MLGLLNKFSCVHISSERLGGCGGVVAVRSLSRIVEEVRAAIDTKISRYVSESLISQFKKYGIGDTATTTVRLLCQIDVSAIYGGGHITISVGAHQQGNVVW